MNDKLAPHPARAQPALFATPFTLVQDDLIRPELPVRSRWTRSTGPSRGQGVHRLGRTTRMATSLPTHRRCSRRSPTILRRHSAGSADELRCSSAVCDHGGRWRRPAQTTLRSTMVAGSDHPLDRPGLQRGHLPIVWMTLPDGSLAVVGLLRFTARTSTSGNSGQRKAMVFTPRARGGTMCRQPTFFGTGYRLLVRDYTPTPASGGEGHARHRPGPLKR
jgi:hypothetical protein